MADRQDSDREVLTSLPRSRPVRRSAKRAARPEAAAAAAPKSATAAKAGRPASKAAAKPKATAKPKAAAAPPKARAKAVPRADAAPAAARTGRPPRKVPPAGYASPVSASEHEGDGGSADLVANVIEAAGELAQIGFAVGRQALQSMFDRLPKP